MASRDHAAASGVVVAGGGAVGLATAWALARQGVSCTVLEKESGPGRHQSGRNSGVIHAGYNLKPGSLKARFCIEGNRRMHAFCEEAGVPLAPSGVLVVARTSAEEETLGALERRAKAQNVPIERLDQDGIQRVEPAARGIAGLRAPTASSVDAGAYVLALQRAAEQAGARVRFGVRVTGWQERDGHVAVQTVSGSDQEVLEAAVFVNAAGLHADRVAGKLATDLRVVPFRGYYARLRPERAHLVRGHIYSVPDLEFPFLGVHLSRRTDGQVFVGPGAMPALGREAYRFLHGDLRDAWSLLSWPGTWRLLSNARIRRLVGRETAKSLWLRAIWNEARRLVPDLRPADLLRGAPAGNRAQLVDRAGRLVDDVVVRETRRSVHVLNAVSPGLTSSIPFGEYLAVRAVRAAGL